MARRSAQPVDLQGDRDRAEEGRGAQLRHPQAGRRIRRRDERPAQGDLRAARRHHGRRDGRRRGRSTCAPRRSTRSSATPARRAPIPSSGTSRRSRQRIERRASASTPPIDDWMKEEAVEPETVRRAPARRWPTKQIADKIAEVDAGRLAPGREEHPAPDRSTITGRSISRRSTRCARSFTCAPMRRRSRSTSTSRRPSCCSSACSTTIREDVTGTLARIRFRLEPHELPAAARLPHPAYRSVHRRGR